MRMGTIVKFSSNLLSKNNRREIRFESNFSLARNIKKSNILKKNRIFLPVPKGYPSCQQNTFFIKTKIFQKVKGYF